MPLPQPRNYTTSAIEQFRNRYIRFKHPDQTENATLSKAVDDMKEEIILLLERAEKFLLPDWGRIFDQHEWEVVAEVPVLARLPFPIMLAEYHCNYNLHSELIPGEQHSSRRISLMAEREAVQQLCPSIYTGANIKEEGIFVASVPYFDDEQLWTPPPSMVFLPRTDDPRDGERNHLVITPLGLVTYDFFPAHERNYRAMRDVNDEVIACQHLLTALAMEKAKTDTIPAPEKLNKKRTRAGKPPMFSYRVLNIVADIMATPRKTTGRPTGSHASPRMHKRRGHVRRLGEGRVTWVRDTIVGSPSRGSVQKDHSLKATTSENE
jgi:hypothetical protein